MKLDYYIPKSPEISFHVAGVKLCESLRNIGWQVQIKTIEDLIYPEADLAVIHPLFHLSQAKGTDFLVWLESMASQYKYLTAQEVADTSKISQRFVSWANHPSIKELFLPSAYSARAYSQSGVIKPMTVVPHGFEPVAPSQRFDFLKDVPAVKSLSFVLHESHRKGFDLILSALAERPDVFFIIKGPTLKDKPLYEIKDNVLIVNHWLSAADLASLYMNCDILFSPHRGGAFELNCLEAICYGLPVVATGYGAVLEYLPDSATSFIGVDQEQTLWSDSADHCGLGASPSIPAVLSALDDMTENLTHYKVSAQSLMNQHRTRFSWRAVTNILSEALKKYESN